MEIDKFVGTSQTVKAGRFQKPSHLMNRSKPEDQKSSGCPCGCGDEDEASGESKAIGSVVSQKALFAIDAPAPRQIVTKSAEEEFEEITDLERELAGNLSKELRSRMREVLAEIRRNSAPTQEMVTKLEQIIRSSKFDRKVVAAVRPYLLSAVESGKQIGIDTVSQIVGPTANPDALFRAENRSLAAYAQVEADKAARRMADSFREYTEAKVRSIVAEAMSEGRSIPEIADALEDWSDETETDIADSRHRAITIARTEAQRAARKTEVAAWKASGVVVGKTWLLAPDPCEFCEAASDLYSKSEAAIGLDAPFFEKGSVLEGADGGNLSLDYEAIDGPPLHPNCRCSLQPRLSDDYEDLILEAEDEVRRLGPFNPENA